MAEKKRLSIQELKEKVRKLSIQENRLLGVREAKKMLDKEGIEASQTRISIVVKSLKNDLKKRKPFRRTSEGLKGWK